jgi:hypothetical protein
MPKKKNGPYRGPYTFNMPTPKASSGAEISLRLAASFANNAKAEVTSQKSSALNQPDPIPQPLNPMGEAEKEQKILPPKKLTIKIPPKRQANISIPISIPPTPAISNLRNQKLVAAAKEKTAPSYHRSAHGNMESQPVRIHPLSLLSSAYNRSLLKNGSSNHVSYQVELFTFSK